MKKLVLVCLLSQLLFSFNLMAQNLGIGTNTPFAYGHGGNNRIKEISNPNIGINIQSHLILSTNGTSGSTGGITWASQNVPGTEKRLGFIGDVYETGNAAKMVFYTRDEAGDLGERLTVLGNGNVGIGAVSPGNYKLKICHLSFGLDIENSFTLSHWEFLTSPSNGELTLFFNHALRGVFNPTTGAYTALSDERLKTNIKLMATMLEKIKQLKPSTYQFKNTEDKQEYNGFIAQDVMKLFPSLVMHNVIPERKLNVYTMDYSGFSVIAVKGIQELQPIIEEQKKKIATLEERITKLEAMLTSKL